MAKSFYKTIKKIDDVKAMSEPTKKVINFVESLVSDDALQKYFFMDFDDSAWFYPLYKRGFFYQIPNVVEVSPGAFQTPSWPAGEYFLKFVDEHEEAAIDVIKSGKTENWRVHEIFIEALMKISPLKTAGLIYLVDQWLDGRFSDMLPIKLQKLTDHLLDNEQIGAAVSILSYIVKPIKPSQLTEYSKYRSDIRFRSDHYWVNEYFEKQVPKLLNMVPKKVLVVFEERLEEVHEIIGTIKPDADKYIGYYWRFDIPSRVSEFKDSDALDILIDGFRDSLSAVCKQNVDEGCRFLEQYLSSHHMIFKRVALYTLRTYGEDYPDLVDLSLKKRGYLNSSEYGNEYLGLLRDQFGNAPEKTQQQVISWILSGPTDLKRRAGLYAKLRDRRVTEQDEIEVKDRWIRNNLAILQEHLSGEAIVRLNYLCDKYGKPDIEEKPRMIISDWVKIQSPFTAMELSQLSPEKLRIKLISYEPENSDESSRESLAQTLQLLVSAEPSRYASFAHSFMDEAVHFIYTRYYLSGMREAIKIKGVKLSPQLIDLCEFIANIEYTENGRFTNTEEKPGLLGAHLEIAHILEQALQSKNKYLTRKQLNRIKMVLIALSHHPNPSSNDDDSRNYDPFTHSLNCVRGMAMHAIFQYALYIVRKRTKPNEKPRTGFIEPDIRSLMDEKIQIFMEPSLAVRAVFGAYIPQIHFLSKDWLLENLQKIFPIEEKLLSFWKAAWDAYIFSSNVYRDVFTLLVPQYQRGMMFLESDLEDKNKYIAGSPTERFAQHIMYAYVADLTNFEHNNRLLDMFFSSAPDKTRSQGIFWLSQLLQYEQPSEENPLWKKCFTLWKKRIQIAEIQDASVNTQEFSNYMRWLKSTPADLDTLYPLLESSKKYIDDGFALKAMIKFAAKYSENQPLKSVTLLWECLQPPRESWWAPDEEDEGKILEDAIEHGNTKAKKIAFDVINMRGEQGDFRWKNLLPEFGGSD